MDPFKLAFVNTGSGIQMLPSPHVSNTRSDSLLPCSPPPPVPQGLQKLTLENGGGREEGLHLCNMDWGLQDLP